MTAMESLRHEDEAMVCLLLISAVAEGMADADGMYKRQKRR